MIHTLSKRRHRRTGLKLFGRFRRDSKGVAALEFAIIAPILILLFIGTLEISLAVSVDRKVGRISSTVADLITQAQTLTTDEVDAIMDVAEKIIYPYDDDIQIEIVGIMIEDGAAEVKWSRDEDGEEPIAKGSPYTVPTSIKIDDTFLVAAVVKTSHQPAFKFVGYANGKLSFDETAIELEEQIFLRPRIGNCVTVGLDGCS